MTRPVPRPALRKAPDAHIHPAAPSAARLQAAEPVPGPRPDSDTPAAPESDAPAPASRLRGPPGGTTSDTLRRAAKASRRSAAHPPGAEKTAPLTVQVPKSLRKELRAAAKAAGRTPDEIVTALLRAWLDR